MNKNASILVIGADSTIGSALISYFRSQGKNVLGTTRKMGGSNYLYLDLANSPSSWPIPENIEAAFICAAETSQEKCRQHPKETRLTNVENTELLAKALHKAGARVIFLSTNLVYDGSSPFKKVVDPTSPQTEYGAQKAEVEKRLMSSIPNMVIVRLTKVIHKSMSLFKQWKTALTAGEEIHPYSNMILTPVSIDFVIQVLAKLLEVDYSGIIQLSGTEDITYEAVARHIADHLGANQSLVQPTVSNQNDLPKYSTLDMSVATKLLGIQPPNVWQAIDAII